LKGNRSILAGAREISQRKRSVALITPISAALTGECLQSRGKGKQAEGRSQEVPSMAKKESSREPSNRTQGNSNPHRSTEYGGKRQQYKRTLLIIDPTHPAQDKLRGDRGYQPIPSSKRDADV